MSDSPDLRIAELSTRQHGVFSRQQSIAAGASPRVINQRLAAGRWSRCHASVYRITGTPRTWLSDLTAACLARPGSIVSHESAGVLHRMRYVPRGVLSIIGTRWSKPLPDVVVHRPKRVFPAAVETISGLAVTDRSTTIIDLASVLPAGRFKRVLDDQLSSHQVKLDDVVAAFERQARRGKKGVALARQLIEERLGGLVIAESELEHLFRERIEPHIVISPTYQFRPSWRTEGIGRADVAFPHHLLLAELDGRRWHLRDIDRENDLRRDNEALERDWRTVRYSYRQITKETAWVIQNLGRILELGPKTPPIR